MSITAKIIWLIVLLGFGFVFPLSFLAAAAVFISILLQANEKPDSKITELQRKGAASMGHSDLAGFEYHLESPAERAFLKAMVSHYEMKVVDGKLVGKNGLTLDMQVELLRYRLDFLVDRRLVVEIDGAAYHSSPEAVVRDRARDAEMRDAGYYVLRIPAKIVFTTPYLAIAQVDAARQTVAFQDKNNLKLVKLNEANGGAPTGTATQKIVKSLAPRRIVRSISNGMSAVDTFSEHVAKASEAVSKAREEEKAKEAISSLADVNAAKRADDFWLLDEEMIDRIREHTKKLEAEYLADPRKKIAADERLAAFLDEHAPKKK